MIVTNEIVKALLGNYSNKDTKLGREVKDGKLIKIKNGLYETEKDVPGYYLAGSIYGPSYLSFDFALSYYGLIPERVTAFTSATYDKKKKKEFKNDFGLFTYRDVPSNGYFYGIMVVMENKYSFQIAIPEKALCDKLYTLSPVNNLVELADLLFNDLRIDMDEFKKMDINKILEISNLYHCRNIKYLYKFMKRKMSN